MLNLKRFYHVTTKVDLRNENLSSSYEDQKLEDVVSIEFQRIGQLTELGIQWRLEDFLEAPTPERVWKPIIQRFKYPKNCMKMKKNWPGWPITSVICLCRSATGITFTSQI